MSRSRKKTIGYCDRNPFMKTYHNRCVRRSNKIAMHKNHEEHHYLPDGRSYRKANCSYDICDYKWLWYSDSLGFRRYLGRWYPEANMKYRYIMK